MSKIVLVLDTDASAKAFADNCQLSNGKFEGLVGLQGYFNSVAGGVETATVEINAGASNADGYMRVAAGGSVAAQACTICNVTLTARASDPATNEFVVSATAATQAANMVNAINASASFAGKVVASLSGADVILTVVTPGAAGNGLQLSAGNLANVTVNKSFAGGSDGTSYSL